MPTELPGHFYFNTETYYDQLDGQMILHHPRYFVFIERAQQAWMESVLGAPRFDWKNFPDMYLVVRRLDAEYLLPIEGVRDITVVLWPVKMRAAKLEVRFEIRSPDLKTLYCRGLRLNCKVDTDSHQPVLWTDAFREAVEGEIIAAEKALPQA
jgi:acyl-CoA thioesterase FadM